MENENKETGTEPEPEQSCTRAPYVNSFNKSNFEYYTPDNAIIKLLEIIPKDYIIWEPCAGEGHIVRFFQKHGYKVISSDIKFGQDFLNYKPNEPYDIIITNPPFNISNKIIQRCYSLKKPFMLLVPFNIMQGLHRTTLFQSYGISLFLLGERIDYIIPEENLKQRNGRKSTCPFWSLWIGYKVPKIKNNTINYLY